MNWTGVFIIRRSGPGWVIAPDRQDPRWTADSRAMFRTPPGPGVRTQWREDPTGREETREERVENTAMPAPVLTPEEIAAEVASVQDSIADTASKNRALGKALDDFVNAWAAQQLARSGS